MILVQLITAITAHDQSYLDELKRPEICAALWSFSMGQVIGDDRRTRFASWPTAFCKAAHKAS
jgi:hypothetical protein